MDSWKSFEKEVARSIRANSILFLRRAANEIVRHDDGKDAAFDHETGTVVTVMTQMALELGMLAFLVEHGKNGIRSVIEDGAGLTDERIREKWLNNSLRTKKFETNKQLLVQEWGGIWRSFDGIVDLFQKSRNKIVHLHFHFTEEDLYDLKFQSTFVLMQAVAYFIFGSRYDHADNIARLLSEDTLKKLVAFRPYQEYVEALADDYASPALCCPICRQRAFSAGLELKCFSCGYQHIDMTLLECSKCREGSVIYDSLNLNDDNQWLPSACLNCGHKSEVSSCKWCTEAFLNPRRELYCSQDCIDDEKSKLDTASANL